MKYDIQISGHEETIDLKKKDDGTVDGTITSPEGGVGTLHGTWSTDGTIEGRIELAGHEAKFSAVLRGDSIDGTIRIKVGPFYVPGPSFTGRVA